MYSKYYLDYISQDLVKSDLDGLSVWNWLKRKRLNYINPNYIHKEKNFFDSHKKIPPNFEADDEPLPLETHPFYLKFWDEFHMSSIEKSMKFTKHDKDGDSVRKL